MPTHGSGSIQKQLDPKDRRKLNGIMDNGTWNQLKSASKLLKCIYQSNAVNSLGPTFLVR